MERQISKHATRLAAAHEAALDSEFAQGARVMTADGVAGTVASVEPGFAQGAEQYRVTLDGGMGGGLYSPGQLRAAPSRVTAAIDEVTADIEPRLASDWYPEMGDILHDRPDPGRQVTVIGSLRKTAAEGWDYPLEGPWYRDIDMDPADSIHRGMVVHLPPEVHRVVHDESRPQEERAFHLTRHLLTHPHPLTSSGAGVGYNWTESPEIARFHAEQGRSYPKGYDKEATPVVLRGLHPGNEHLEHDPWMLRERSDASLRAIHGPVPEGGYAAWHRNPAQYPSHEDLEYSVRDGGTVPLTGISWARAGHTDEDAFPFHMRKPFFQEDYGDWVHHDFPEGIRVQAVLQREAAAWYDDPQHAPPGTTLYRGISRDLDPELHRYVHDESIDPVKRGHRLTMDITRYHGAPPGYGVGHSWTDDPDIARNYAEIRSPWSDVDHSHATPVVMHIRTPDRQHWDPDDSPEAAERYQEWVGGGVPSPEGREINMRSHAPLPLIGVSWAPENHAGKWITGDREEVRHAPGLFADPAWHHFHLPEGFHVRASRQWLAADPAWEDA